MNNNQFLIPANTKKGQLIFNLFLPVDLIILSTGVGITLLLLIIFSNLDLNTLWTIIAIVPGGISAILVFPFPNYHNVRVGLGDVINYYSNRQKYIWRGWCVGNEPKRK